MNKTMIRRKNRDEMMVLCVSAENKLSDTLTGFVVLLGTKEFFISITKSFAIVCHESKTIFAPELYLRMVIGMEKMIKMTTMVRSTER